MIQCPNCQYGVMTIGTRCSDCEHVDGKDDCICEYCTGKSGGTPQVPEVRLIEYVRSIISDATDIIGKALEELNPDEQITELDALIKSCKDLRQQAVDYRDLNKTTPEDRRQNRAP